MGASYHSAGDLAALYRTLELDPVQVAEAALEAAHAAQDSFNAIAAFNEDCLRPAEASRERFRAGCGLGPLDGVPVTVKDSYRVAGLRRWHGSAVHDGAGVSVADSAPVLRLKEAGAVLVAKTAMPDFGMLASGIIRVRGHPQPVGSGVHPGWIERRSGRHAGGRRRARRDGYRRRRLGAASGSALRRRGDQADPGAHRICAGQHGPLGWAHGAPRRRPGDHARVRWPSGCERPVVPARPVRGSHMGRRSHPRQARGHAHGHGVRAARRRRDARRRGQGW